MNESSIAADFTERPDELYSAPEQLNPEARRELFEIEEGLVTLLARQNLAGATHGTEEQVARAADALLNGEATGQLSPAAIRSYLDAQRMADRSPREALPEVLSAVVARSLKPDAATTSGRAAVPAMIVRLEAGLQVIKSVARGLRLQTEELVATRAAVSTPEARRSQVILKEVVDDRLIEYEILSESDESVSLLVRFPEAGASRARIRVALREEGRLVDSRSPDDEGQICFQQLASGNYELEFSGALRHRCPIVIDGARA